MQRLSRHTGVNLYDVRKIVNVHELRHDFHRLPLIHRTSGKTLNEPVHALYSDSVQYHVDRRMGRIIPVKGDFRSKSINQFYALLGIHLKLFYEEIDAPEIDVHIEARRLQGGTTHPGASEWETKIQDNTTIMCIGHENVDGGHLEVKDVVKKELSPAHFIELTAKHPFRFTPIMSFDGSREAHQDVYIITSHVIDRKDSI